MVNYQSPFAATATALRDIMELLQNIKHPNLEVRNLIIELLALLFNLPADQIDIKLLKLNKNKHISDSPFLEVEEISHCRILPHWDEFTFGVNNVLTPLTIDIVVPKELWWIDGKQRILLLADKLYRIFQLQQITSIGDLELVSVKPITLQNCAGLSFQFYTMQNE